MNKRIVYVRLQHPSGRVTTKKLKVKSKNLSGIQREYLGTAEHFRTEAFPIKVLNKKPKVIKKRKTSSPFGIRMPKFRL